jgi:DNA (cytosine-5)-methyltransferase 1
MGYKTKAVAISAKDLGADHVRKRYWLLAYSDSDSELSLPLNAEVAKLQSVRPGVWDTYSDESGMVDGVANRVDRLRAIGNGQVPAVVRAAWEELAQGKEP